MIVAVNDNGKQAVQIALNNRLRDLGGDISTITTQNDSVYFVKVNEIINSISDKMGKPKVSIITNDFNASVIRANTALDELMSD